MPGLLEGKRTVFSMNGAEQLDITWGRMISDSYLVPFTKTNSKWTKKDPRVRTKTIKLLKENTRVNLLISESTTISRYDIKATSNDNKKDHLLTVSIVLSVAEGYTVGTREYVSFTVHVSFLHVLSWLDDSFLFSTNNISLCWYTIVYLLSHLL